MNRTRTVLTALPLLSVLALGACSGDDPQPKVAPPSSSAPTSPSNSPAPHGLGPVGTVRAWVDAQNSAMESGDTTAVRSLAADDCVSCDGLVDPIDDVFAAGGHFETDGWRVDRAKLVKSSNGKAVVDAAVTIAGGETVNAAGQQPVVFQVERSILVFKLAHDGEAWAVSFVGFLS